MAQLLYSDNQRVIDGNRTEIINEDEIKQSIRNILAANQYPVAISILGFGIGFLFTVSAVLGFVARMIELLAKLSTQSSVDWGNYLWMGFGVISGSHLTQPNEWVGVDVR